MLLRFLILVLSGVTLLGGVLLGACKWLVTLLALGAALCTVLRLALAGRSARWLILGVCLCGVVAWVFGTFVGILGTFHPLFAPKVTIPL